MTILLTFLLWAVIFLVGAAVIFLVLGHGSLARLVALIYSAVASVVIYPLLAIFYVLLREEKEGMTPAQIAAPVE